MDHIYQGKLAKRFKEIFCLTVLFALLSFYANAQNKQVGLIDTSAVAIYVDNLDFIYLQTERGELLKYSSTGQLKWRYSNNRFGKLHSVDVSDPMRVLLFYADFQQIVVLNNNLNEILNYSFAAKTNLQVSAVAAGNNNSLWLFERNANTLIKYSANFTEDIATANLSQLFNQVINPIKIAATDQYVFLQHSDNTILQFDRFGAFVRDFQLPNLTQFSLTNHNIVYHQANQLILYNVNTLNTVKQPLPTTLAVKQLVIGNKIIAVLTEKAVFLLSNN